MHQLLEKYSRFRRAAADHETYRLIQMVEININTALLQCQRISEDYTFLSRQPAANRGAFLTLFADIHFFVVATDDIRKCLETLRARLGGDLKQISKQYRTFFKAVTDMRDHHEHLDEKIDASDLYYGKALLDDWTFEMCGFSLKVGPAVEERLLSLYEAIDKALALRFLKKDKPFARSVPPRQPHDRTHTS